VNPDLRATEFLDHTSVEVQDFVTRTAPASSSPVEAAVALYRAVRDGIHYEVYGADLSRSGLRASTVLRRGSGMCLHKSIVYAAALRAVGVPARLVLTDVRNHLASPRLREFIGGDVFRYHCLVSVHLNGRWVKATPVFNKLLCRLYRIEPLEFDGSADSIYHPYNLHGQRHMEFLRFHGEFTDLPYDLVLDGLRAAHPRIFAGPETSFVAGSLITDARPRMGAQQ
jgi:transglutaminase-like putative cysteine protease